MKKRVLSGIRASGKLHLGNYLGAVKGMLELQNNPEYETLYMVADAHALTTPFNVEELRLNRREVFIDYLAAGLDPQKSIIFQQSDVNQHFELAFYFSSAVTIAKMQHLPTFKDKVKQYPQHATMALLNYPILMAADILVYKAGLVPVGIDQEPHLEVAREIARKMNADFGTDFPEPKRFATQGEYVPSLTGEGKMGKSIEGSYINLTDDLETIQKKLARVPTDSGKGSIENGIYLSRTAVNSNVHSPAPSNGVKTLMTLIELFIGKNRSEELQNSYQNEGLRYGDLKKELAQAIYEELQPFQEKRARLAKDQKYVDSVIQMGAEKARALATETIQEVRKKMGLQ